MNTPKLAPASGDMLKLRDAYLEAQLMQGSSERSLESWRGEIRRFTHWCEMRAVLNVKDVTKPVLERYRAHLFYSRKSPKKDGTGGGEPLSLQTQSQRLIYLKSWFKWLTRRDYLPANPAAELDLPKVPESLPKAILAPAEVERVLGMPDITDTLGLRDRAMLEVIYATGLRRMEVARLSLYAIDQAQRTVHVQQGKGRKDRLVPLTERALGWIDRYLRESRPLLAIGTLAPYGVRGKPGPKQSATRAIAGYQKKRKYGHEMPPGVNPKDALFLTKYGEPFDVGTLGLTVKQYMTQAELEKVASCHTLRHSMATGMLNNGADIRFVQAMLGHASLETTQIYTRVSIEKLRQVCEATHPSRKAQVDDTTAPGG